MARMNRRQFHKSAALAGIATAASYNRVLGANDRVGLGLIGLGNRGDQVLDAFLPHKNCDVVAACDIWQPYIDFAAKKIIASREGSAPAIAQAKNYEKVLAMKDVDAVVINTPD